MSATYYETLDAMLPVCGYVIIVCPLTPETEGMFSEKRFRLMNNSATIINIARGERQLITTRCLLGSLLKNPQSCKETSVAYVHSIKAVIAQVELLDTCCSRKIYL